MNWFDGCQTLEEVRIRYRDLARKHHPDVGGSTRDMQDINSAYTSACKGHTRRQAPNRAESYYAHMDFVSEVLRKIILQLLRLPEIKIEICGSWLWVTGNTRPVKEDLKGIGLRFSGKKQAWYYAGCPTASHGKYSLNQIRSFYGSKVVVDEDSMR